MKQLKQDANRTTNSATEPLDVFVMTEIGELPSEWEAIGFGRIVSLRREAIEPKEHPEDRYIGHEHMDSEKPRLSRSGLGAAVRGAKTRFYPGDILY
jgi:hypothetical protein